MIKIVSTLEGITAYDEKGQVLSLKNKKTENVAPEIKKRTHSNTNVRTKSFEPTEESTENSEEAPKSEEAMEPLSSLKNLLKKGTVELTKKDISTAEPLPKTGIRILDKNGKLVVEERTDEKGQFKFKILPAGKYTFKEFDAPKGYELDETPLPFEKTEDGKNVKCEMSNKRISEKSEPKIPQIKEIGRLPQTGEQKQTKGELFIGLLLIASFAGAMGWKVYQKNRKKDKE